MHKTCAVHHRRDATPCPRTAGYSPKRFDGTRSLVLLRVGSRTSTDLRGRFGLGGAAAMSSPRLSGCELSCSHDLITTHCERLRFFWSAAGPLSTPPSFLSNIRWRYSDVSQRRTRCSSSCSCPLELSDLSSRRRSWLRVPAAARSRILEPVRRIALTMCYPHLPFELSPSWIRSSSISSGWVAAREDREVEEPRRDGGDVTHLWLC